MNTNDDLVLIEIQGRGFSDIFLVNSADVTVIKLKDVTETGNIDEVIHSPRSIVLSQLLGNKL
jgi:hypothetical protein